MNTSSLTGRDKLDLDSYESVGPKKDGPASARCVVSVVSFGLKHLKFVHPRENDGWCSLYLMSPCRASVS